MADIIEVRNIGTVPFEGAYDSKRFRIEPGQKTILDREAAIIHLGNWNTRNLDPSHMDRTQEYLRIRGLYGTLPSSGPDQNGQGPEDRWRERAPKVELYEIDGRKITTLLEDPEGKSLSLEDASERDKGKELQMLRERLDEMERELKSERNMNEPVVMVDEDSPDTAPRRRGRPPKIEGVDPE